MEAKEQVVLWLRFGADWMPYRRRMVPAVCSGPSRCTLKIPAPRHAVIAGDGARLGRRIRAEQRPRSGDPRVALDHAFVHRDAEARGARANQVAALQLP